MTEEIQVRAKRKRSRPDAERQLCHAVEQLLLKGGFGAVTPSAVAREAGLDKMLIYRYFGDLPGLVRRVISRPGFFPDFESLCGGQVEAIRALSPPARASHILERFIQLQMDCPVALELMAWELIERNELTAIAEEARETLGLRIITELFDDQPRERTAAVTALLASALTYLLLRRRKIRVFDGLDLHDSDTWARLVSVSSDMVAGVFSG